MPTHKKLLLLGGTADARRIATTLHQQSVELVYSLAGLVRTPDIGCELVVGGFSQFGGLASYIAEHQIDAVLDVTHPYAQQMSSTAVQVCQQLNIPCWRFHRPAWIAQPQDRWIELDSWQTLPQQLSGVNSVLLTAGQMDQALIEVLAEEINRLHLRTAVQPKYPLPSNVNWIKAIGPFDEDSERALMALLGVQALVSKNSGGSSTEAKLAVARERGIPVYMLQRPELPEADQCFSDPDECAAYVIRWATGDTL